MHDHRLLLALFGALTRLRSSGLGFPHPPRGDSEDLNADARRTGRRRATQLRRCLRTRRVRRSRGHRGRCRSGTILGSRASTDAADTPDRAGDDPGPPITEGPDRIEDPLMPHPARWPRTLATFAAPIMALPFSGVRYFRFCSIWLCRFPESPRGVFTLLRVIPARPLVMGHLPGADDAGTTARHSGE